MRLTLLPSTVIMTQAFLLLARRSSSALLARAFTTTNLGRQPGLALLAKRAAKASTSSAPFGSRRRFTSGASTVEEELDAALDNLLGSAAKGSDSGKRIKLVQSIIKDGSAEGKLDYHNPEFRSTHNPYWEEIGIRRSIIDVLSAKGITQFTPVQAQVFEPIISRRDVIGRSRTGTGKTLAFGLGGMTRLVKFLEENGKRDPTTGRMMRGRQVSMLILCPTRELARQVEEELALVAKPLGLETVVVHGGVSISPQAQALRSGKDVIVGTPGRVIDLLDRRDLSLAECDVVVLDEADEMLNMGFADDVEHILERAGSANRQQPQCLLFSATTPTWVQDIARKYQQDVLKIDSTGDEGGARVAKTVRHLAIQVPPGLHARKAILEDIIAVHISRDSKDEEDENLKNNPIAAAAMQKKKKMDGALQQKMFGKTIVFTNTKREADDLVSGGVFKSLSARAIHGDVSQSQRDATLNAFRAGAFNVLCATDVAARGIDVSEVDLVVQLDPPRDVDSYVHRSGRTGRAGKKGVSVLLFSGDQGHDVVRIERDLGHGFQFEMMGPPSTEAALKASAMTCASACAGISEEVASYFREAAADLLRSSENPEDIVARCLAAISRRASDIQVRSLLSGEPGMVTVQMAKKEGSGFTPGDVVYTVGQLARQSQSSDEAPFSPSIGMVQMDFKNGVALFDMDHEDAKKLIDFSQRVSDGNTEFALVKQLEIDRSQTLRDIPPSRYGGGMRRGSANSFRGRSERSSYSSGRSQSYGRGQGYGSDHRPPPSDYHRRENFRDTRGNDRGSKGRYETQRVDDDYW